MLEDCNNKTYQQDRGCGTILLYSPPIVMTCYKVSPFRSVRSDAEFNPFIFLLICHKSKQPIDMETESLITLINND